MVSPCTEKKCFKVSGHKQFILAKITNNALDCGTALRLCLQTTVSEVMMAPVYVAYRLASLLLCVVSVFLSVSNCYSPLVYDRQLLLDIKDSIVTTYNSELASSVVRSQSCFPNSILDVPDYLRRWHPVISLEKASQETREARRGCCQTENGVAHGPRFQLLSYDTELRRWPLCCLALAGSSCALASTHLLGFSIYDLSLLTSPCSPWWS